ncbi:MAG: HypC/HybG/HupF family hydrogenase formation chaperone [Actinobacteria bacterium]|nr:HypC/HybG/HupF family hydrogenase formation chaperone [Actinomycetota bacterium]
MCIAVPVRVTAIERNALGIAVATVDVGGSPATVRLDYVPEAEVGDYVMAHMGFALNRVDEEDARETLDVLRQVEEASPPRIGG